jgi:ribosomal protein S18 acetylase RimI-like enzyme
VALALEQVTYRNAEPRDAKALAALARNTFVATFGHLYPPEDLNAFIAEIYTPEVQAKRIADPEREIRLAGLGDDLIGYCGIGAMKLPFDTQGRRAFELHTLYVVEAAKGRGVAAAMMDWALQRARAHDAQDIYLGVYHANERALAFYKRYGFEVVGRYDFPVGKTIDDERIMRLTLRS